MKIVFREMEQGDLEQLVGFTVSEVSIMTNASSNGYSLTFSREIVDATINIRVEYDDEDEEGVPYRISNEYATGI